MFKKFSVETFWGWGVSLGLPKMMGILEEDEMLPIKIQVEQQL